MMVSSDESYLADGRNSSEASLTYPKQYSALRRGDHVIINKRPCRIVELSTSTPGKHGHAKVHLVGLDVFTGGKQTDVRPASHCALVPVTSRRDYLVIYVDDHSGYMSLLDLLTNTIKKDLRVPEGDQAERLVKWLEQDEDDVLVTVMTLMNRELVANVRKQRRNE